MNLHDLLINPPQIHADANGNLTSWQIDNEVLYYIDQNISPKSQTLETGAGISTILFALKGSNHTCIVPDQDQIHRIQEYCLHNGISTEKIIYDVGESEWMLPKLQANQFDLILIDGRHAFPTPFIDWYYTAPKLKIGGTFIIDDTHLWTGEVLMQFMEYEIDWKIIERFSKSAVFRKLSEGSHAKEWVHQPYVIKKSARGIRRERFRYGLNLVREGKYIILINRFFKMLNKS